MKITKVTLQNFRGIGSLELEFPIDQSVITLVGINGVGKSSILDAVTMTLRAVLFISNYTNLLSPNGMDKNKYFRDSDVRIMQQKVFCGVTLSSGHESYDLKISKAIGRREGADEIKKRELPRIKFNYLLVYYSSGRQVQKISYTRKEIDKAVSSNIDYVAFNIDNDVPAIDETSDFDNFFAWFKELEDIENEERLETSEYRSSSLESVRNAVYSVLGGGFDRLRVKRATNDLIINKDGVDIPVACLSDGEKSLIALVSDLARKLSTTYPTIKKPLEGEAIVLIDEIELHMHPKWQRMIIPRLTKTFPSCQFIVTTHSPQVLSHVQPESIYLLKKVGEDIVVTKPQYSYGRDSNRILEDLMDETERPAEIQDQLAELFSLIHQGQLSSAQELVSQLAATIGASEPELNKAEVMIKRREIIGR
jgi:predicted ATP-binding protein involved in virulence